MTNPNLTEIICVVDRSGSMGSIRDDAVGGFNTFLAEQKKVDRPCKFTYAQFDSEYELVHNGVALHNVRPLDHTTYVPRGSTALLDAIGRTVNEVGARLQNTPEDERPGKVLFVILTDGHENSSQEFTRPQINEMITHQRDKYKWEFIFLAANQDAIKTGGDMGISRSFNFAATGQFVKGVYASAARSVTSYRLADDEVQCNAALDGMSDCVEAPDLDAMLTSQPETAGSTKE